MKRIILPLLCFFISAAAYGDDYTTTTILNNPVGIFDNLTVSGASVLGDVEIGAKQKNSSLPLAQSQKLTVYGTTELLPQSGTQIDIGGSLYLLGGGGTQYTFNNVNIYKNSLLYLGAGYSGASLAADQIDAKIFRTFSSFTEGASAGSESVLTISSGTPFRAGVLKFSDGTNIKTLDSPRNYGSRVVWADVQGGDTADSYGPWSGLIASGQEPDDTCCVSCSVGDKIGEFVCPSTYKHGENNAPNNCTDVRRSLIKTKYYSTNGGVYFSHARARRECFLANDNTCKFSTYSYTDVAGSPAPANDCPFNASEVQSIIGAGNTGLLCNELCKSPANPSGECSGSSSCIIRDDNLYPLQSGAPQSGVADCNLSGWPIGSGLECKNAWQEKSLRVLHCGAGSGKEYLSGTYYQTRTVVCGTGGSTGVAPGTFLTVDYEYD